VTGAKKDIVIKKKANVEDNPVSEKLEKKLDAKLQEKKSEFSK
jgi:hypothetical protein